MTSEQPARTGILDTIPATALVLLAISAIQVGAALATQLFPALGAAGTVATRIVFAAALLLLVARKRLYTLPRIVVRHWRLLGAFGTCIAAMNLCFYLAIDRIPLGAAVTIEFVGPLGLAAIMSRHATQFFWVALAGVGIVLLSPLSGVQLDPVGVAFALTAGLGWALFAVLSGHVGRRIPGHDGLVLGMCVAAVLMVPLVTPVVGVLVTQPLILLAGLAVALLSTSLPFTLEFSALQRLTPRAYGVLVSLEPAVAALAGAVMLGERIGGQGALAVVCVVVAALGITLFERNS